MAKSLHSVEDQSFPPAESFLPEKTKGLLPEQDHFHRPVMTAEVIEFFKPVREGIFLDATVGGGGHSAIIMNELKPQRLIGIDQDPEAVEAARSRLISARDRLDPARNRFGSYEIFCEKFSNLKSVLDKLGIEKISGILFDLGVSLHQLTTPERGFSFTLDGPLDMRMSGGQPGGAGPTALADRNGKTCPASQTALQVIKTFSERQLVEIFSKYGEEHYSKRIARAIANSRKKITSTTDLAQVIRKAVPRAQPVASLARVFQALRIYVNNELDELAHGLRIGIGVLAPAGRIVVLAYHSLEDRIVKRTFKDFERNGSLSILTKKPLRPSPAEILSNPRSRSARLRAAEKVA